MEKSSWPITNITHLKIGILFKEFLGRSIVEGLIVGSKEKKLILGFIGHLRGNRTRREEIKLTFPSPASSGIRAL